jgi:pimeloyl-ACP methyl ester carboxylesterase
MPCITTPGGVRIEYETIGDDRGSPMLLIQGLGAPLVGWRPELCQALAAQGFRVIRFDNRDCGLSQKFPEGRYLLADMADDAIGLLDALNIGRAHVVGQSLGGMIAQELVLRRPDKVARLCLIYTAPNSSHILNERDMTAITARPRARSREEAIEQYLADESFCVSQAYEFDTAWIRALGGIIWDRCYYPEGIPRQLDAAFCSPDRTAALGAVTTRTLIIHGDTDRLIDVSGSHALAQALPHATLRIFAGMGHELPPPLWPELIQAITGNANGLQEGAEPGNIQRVRW